MPEANLSGSWVEAKAALSMTDGASYVVEFHGPPTTRIQALDVLGAAEPTSDEGALIHYTRDEYPAQEALEFEARSGWTWWLRTVDGGPASVVSAAI